MADEFEDKRTIEENKTLQEKRTSVDPDVKDPVLDRFEEAWRRGEQPDIDAYLPDNPNLRRGVLSELVHIDLLHRLGAGQSVRLESYLERYPELHQEPSKLLDLINAEYAARQLRADVTFDEYLQRFPQHAEKLRKRFAAATIPDFPPPPTPRIETLPQEFGRYRILHSLGSGAMGDVYQAHDTYLQRSVALKVPAFARVDKDVVSRFLVEAKAAAVLHHPNICPLYEAGEIQGIPYFTMAYIEGLPLSRKYPLPLPPRQAADLVRQLALALAHAHEKGVVHRDLKPGNIMINARSEPIILDFGLALRITAEDMRATRPGIAMGTPAYMAPEQALGQTERMGPGCDIFSLGVIFYELLTGHSPFSGGSIFEVMQRVAHEEPARPAQLVAGLDRRLEAICLKSMAKRIDERYASMTEFAAALHGWLEQGAPPPAAAAKKSAAQLDPRFVEEAMGLVRQWGWERSLEILKSRIQTATDAAKVAGLRLLIGWLAGERGWHEEAQAQFRDSAAWPVLAAWALVGEAFLAMRQKNFEAARAFLTQAGQQGDPNDTTLQGAIAHLLGSIACHQGKFVEAGAELHAALEKVGPDHFTTGRVLDSLGMLQAVRNNFRLAFEYYTRALEIKQRFRDDAGVALAHGQLGRLCLDWGRLDEADTHFRRGIDMARRIGDERGEAQLCNHRGQVLLRQGKPAEAEALLDETIRSARGRWLVIEGYGHKDRALARLEQGDQENADQECDQAGQLFVQAGFAEGEAYVMQVRGLIRRAQGRLEEALRCFREGASRFEEWGEPENAAQCHWQLARTMRQRGAAAVLIAEVLSQALDQAEKSRRDHLVRAVEKDLQEAAPAEFVKRFLRGSGALGTAATEEVVTLLALELREEPESNDSPATRLERCNDLFAEIEDVLAKQDVRILQYRGEGFLALCRGRDHARRAVSAALDVVQTLQEFNRSRRVLGWPVWQVCQALTGGLVCIDKVGTCRKFDRTVAGPPVALVSRLLAEAEVNRPCADEVTFEAAAALFPSRPGGGRTVHLKALGPQRVWDLTR